MLAQKSSWSKARLVGLGVATSGGHVLLSVILGFGIVYLGLVFSSGLSSLVTATTGGIMLVVGLSYGVRTLLSRVQEDYEEEVDQELKKAKASGRGVAYFVVLGGALSPDLSILPILLLAIPFGLGLVLDAAMIFAIASVLSLVLLVLAGSMGIARIMSKAPPKLNEALVGFVVAGVGAYVLIFG